MSLLSVLTGQSHGKEYEATREEYRRPEGGDDGDDEIAALEEQFESLENELEEELEMVKEAESDLKSLDQRIVSEHKFLAKLIGKDYFARKFDKKWQKLQEFEEEIEEVHSDTLDKVKFLEEELKTSDTFSDHSDDVNRLLSDKYTKSAVEQDKECPRVLKYFIIKLRYARTIIRSLKERIDWIRRKTQDVREELRHPDRELYDVAKNILSTIGRGQFRQTGETLSSMKQYSLDDVR